MGRCLTRETHLDGLGAVAVKQTRSFRSGIAGFRNVLNDSIHCLKVHRALGFGIFSRCGATTAVSFQNGLGPGRAPCPLELPPPPRPRTPPWSAGTALSWKFTVHAAIPRVAFVSGFLYVCDAVGVHPCGRHQGFLPFDG